MDGRNAYILLARTEPSALLELPPYGDDYDAIDEYTKNLYPNAVTSWDKRVVYRKAIRWARNATLDDLALANMEAMNLVKL